MSSDRLKHVTRTVGFRLTLLHSAVFGVLAILLLGLAYLMLREAIETRERDQIEFRYQQFFDQYRRAGIQGIKELCTLRRGRVQKAFFVRVADPQNNTLFFRDPEDWTEFSPARMKHPENAQVNEKVWKRLDSRDDYFLELQSCRLPDGNVLQVGKTSEDARDLLARFRYYAFLTVGLLIPIGFLGAAVLSMRLLRPVKQLSETVVGILRTGSFAARVPSRHTGDELDELVELFNSLLSRIGSLIRAMKESLDNVAHDLRTPMTRLRNVAHTTLEKEAGLADTREALVECVEESERVLTMLNTLMDIAEAENGLLRIKRAKVHVREVLEDVIDLYQAVADEDGVAISLGAADSATVAGDPVLLRRAIANLLDNAIKYTPRGGAVTITTTRDDGSIVIEVTDTGMGVAPEDLPRIWDRLYRADKSRSKRGLGLGLSFVVAIIRAHGGRVTAESTLGEGSTFRVFLPVEAEVADSLPAAVGQPGI